MKPKLQRLEIEPAILGDDDFAIQHATRRQLRPQRLEQFGKIAVQRLFIAALDLDLVPVAKNQRAKPIPLRFEDPRFAGGQVVHSLGEHRQDRRVDGKIHAHCYTAPYAVESTVCAFLEVAGKYEGISLWISRR